MMAALAIRLMMHCELMMTIADCCKTFSSALRSWQGPGRNEGGRRVAGGSLAARGADRAGLLESTEQAEQA